MTSANCTWSEDYPDEECVRFDLSENGLFVLEENGNMIGACSLIGHDDLDELNVWTLTDSCVPARLCVRPDRQGLAGRIVEAIEAEAQRRGYASVRLLAAEQNVSARAVYEGRGYRARCITEMYGQSYVAMEKALAQRYGRNDFRKPKMLSE